MNRTIFNAGIVFGVLAIAMGAFGAHGLSKLVDADAIQTYETGISYQMYHALFLLVLSGTRFLSEKSKKLPFYLVVGGVLLFSFSIYFLATNTLTTVDFKSIGFITPIGGLLLIAGWVLTGYRVWKQVEN